MNSQIKVGASESAVTETFQRARVVQEAQSWLGTPYVLEGRTKGVGVDCAQLLIAVYSAAGLVQEFTPQPYGVTVTDNQLLLKWIAHFAGEIPGPPQPGDLAVFDIGAGYAPGIVVDWPEMISSYMRHGVQSCDTSRENTMYGDALKAGRPVKFFSLFVPSAIRPEDSQIVGGCILRGPVSRLFTHSRGTFGKPKAVADALKGKR